MSKIISVKEIGQHQTYDLEVDHPDHQFYLANGMLTSNSHAIAYAIDSYYGAWLTTHYETDWLATCLQSENTNVESLAWMISEIKQLGYSIARPDINFSTKEWSWSPELKAFVPPLSSLKGVGESAVEEIVANRPYKSIEDMLWNEDGTWRHSKFNKKAMDALIKMEALASMWKGPESWHSYRQLHHVIVENIDLIKKSTKKDPLIGRKNFQELMENSQDIPDWTRDEKIENIAGISGAIDINYCVDPDVMQRLLEKEVKSIDELEDSDVCWFVAKSAHVKQTKNGKNYLLIEAIGPSGSVRKIFCWGWDPNREIEPYSTFIGEVTRGDFGLSVKSWKLKEI